MTVSRRSLLALMGIPVGLWLQGCYSTGDGRGCAEHRSDYNIELCCLQDGRCEESGPKSGNVCNLCGNRVCQNVTGSGNLTDCLSSAIPNLGPGRYSEADDCGKGWDVNFRDKMATVAGLFSVALFAIAVFMCFPLCCHILSEKSCQVAFAASGLAILLSVVWVIVAVALPCEDLVDDFCSCYKCSETRRSAEEYQCNKYDDSARLVSAFISVGFLIVVLAVVICGLSCCLCGKQKQQPMVQGQPMQMQAMQVPAVVVGQPVQNNNWAESGK